MGRRGTARLVEIDPSGLRWAKSSASSSGSGNCLEFAIDGDRARLRSSKNRAPRLIVPAESFAHLISFVTNCHD